MYSQSEADLVRENRMLSEQLELAHRAQSGLSLDVRALSEQLADAQATVEALQRERDLYKRSADTFAECVDNVREAMGLESTHYLVLPDDVGDMRKERDQLKTALDAEREKVKEIEKVLDIDSGKTTLEKIIDLQHSFKQVWGSYQDAVNEMFKAQSQLSQLQALVRALPKLDFVETVYAHESGVNSYMVGGLQVRFKYKADRDAYVELLRYRATLGENS